MTSIEAKVVFLGSQGVGKTSLINRYVNKCFNPQANQTVGASFITCRINVNNAKITFNVWDTAGQERFRSMAPMYYRHANLAFIVFDITNYDTFADTKSWIHELKRNVDEPMVLILAGNKLDLAHERKVDAEEARVYAESIGARYYEISALNDEGVEEAFLVAAKGLLRLSRGENPDFLASLRLTREHDVPLQEEVLDRSIAHGIDETPFPCC